eukprot:389661-Amphidinium_carterae.1
MSTFAATPPMETLTLLCSLCTSAPESDDFVIQVWDISRAHQHCKLKRKVFLKKTRAQERNESFEHTIGETLTQNGLKQ